MTINITNEGPNKFVKAYPTREIARSFVERGRLWIRPIEYFRSVECTDRNDPLEGQLRHQIRDDDGEIMKMYGSFSNRVLIFCGSSLLDDGTVSHLDKFGDQIIEVFNSTIFLDRLKDAVGANPDIGKTSLIDYCQVRYDKGELVDKASLDRMRANYACKPEKFAHEREVRVIICLQGLNKAPEITDHVEVCLHNPSDYCRFL